MNKKAFPVIWYPFLFAAYPVLGLLAHNVGNARPEAGFRPVAAAVLGAAVLFGLLRLLMRDWHRAAFVSAAWVSLFAAYGHVYIELQKKAPEYARTDLLAGACLLLAAGALFLATRPRVRMEAWTLPLNIAAVALVVLPIGQIIQKQIVSMETPQAPTVPLVQVTGTRPDIYYIILDMYTRADTFQNVYKYDNSEFLGGLEGMGFSIAECSMSNYVRTELSLASSLNMVYLTSDLDPRFNPDSQVRSPLWKLIRESAVTGYLRERGYQTVAFATGYPWSELDNSDQYLKPDPVWGGMTEFETLLLETTAFRILDDEGLINLDVFAFNRYRERTRYVLDTLPTLAGRNTPQFVFVHLIIPHPPFVFAEDGSPVNAFAYLNEDEVYPARQFAEGYTMQTKFINREITRIVQEIIANSDTPPVIIIQGDHGPWLQPKERRLSILNAYYLPGHPDAISGTITPVNTFRVVFNLYLGGDFELLPDESFYSPVPNHFDFELIPNRCNSK